MIINIKNHFVVSWLIIAAPFSMWHLCHVSVWYTKLLLAVFLQACSDSWSAELLLILALSASQELLFTIMTRQTQPLLL